MDWTQRTEMILGAQSMSALKSARVAVFGLGGVGSYAAEALVRAGVGHISLLDGDVYEQNNLNRQLYATMDTLGRPKAEAARERALAINPECDAKALS
ncbi:MAG: ThiF family adenylyltransferase, partial [Clostridia bacterium]|nr:ThiF family adenylyltransferase [Clostridia bacterium]